jgi:alkanesulfonate monooxygenase SsuD/methylene tetrahydromethanopterin reductase-like flavin-dependent oxidoreductase (luciferase family)
MQQPHPKIFIVGTGSPETIAFAASKGFGYAATFIPRTRELQLFEQLQEMSERHGHSFGGDKRMIGMTVYVAETDEKAEAEVMEHLRFFFEDGLRTTPRYLMPPGYVSLAHFRDRVSRPALHGEIDWEAMRSNFRVVWGAPDTVGEALVHWIEEAKTSRVSIRFHFGNMPHWKVVKNMTLFAEQVMPRLRPPRG